MTNKRQNDKPERMKMHGNDKRNAMLTETEKTRKRNKNYSKGGCSSNQGVCRNKPEVELGLERVRGALLGLWNWVWAGSDLLTGSVFRPL